VQVKSSGAPSTTIVGSIRELSGRARVAASGVDGTAQISSIVEPDARSAGAIGCDISRITLSASSTSRIAEV
jgi:hypothetical protein